jgi:ABC-type branched-subunit amino acid transport system substrate-binding protein
MITSMKKSVILFFLFLLLQTNQIFAQGEKEVNIGFILPLSGDWAFLGEDVRDAAMLASKNIVDEKLKLNLKFEDNAGQLKESATIANKLINIDKVDVIVSVISGVGLLINPIAEKAEVLNFGICSNTKVADGVFNFTNYITTNEGANSYLNELEKRTEIKGRKIKLGIFSVNEAGFNQISEQVISQSKNRKIEIVFKESFEPKTFDFRTQIAKSFLKNPDRILLLGLSPEIEIFVKQLRQLKKDIHITSIEAIGLSKNKSEFAGSWYVDPAAPNDNFQKDFYKYYKRTYTPPSAFAYDITSIIYETYKSKWLSSNKPLPIEIVNSLHNQKQFFGVVGNLELDKNGIFHSTPSIKEVEY